MCGAENMWWGNQGILGAGDRHDNIDPSFYYCVCTKTKYVEREITSDYSTLLRLGYLPEKDCKKEKSKKCK